MTIEPHQLLQIIWRSDKWFAQDTIRKALYANPHLFENTKKGWQLTEAGRKEALREPAIYCRYLPEEAVAYYLNSVFRPEERGFIR